MNAERRFFADLEGFNAEVIHLAGAASGVGIGTFTAIDEPTGQPLFGLAIRHADGTMVAALLDEALINDLAAKMADHVEALPPIRSEARH